MELSSPLTNTLKITSKQGTILIDPLSLEDAKVVILDDGVSTDFTTNNDNLIIYGPGDFEASGILIKGTRPENDTMYSIDTQDFRVLHVLSTSIAKLVDEDDYDAVIVKAVSPVTESVLSALSSKLVVVYGDLNNIPDLLKSGAVYKINLRKKEELLSNVVYLEKK